jgi:hypothetical protein
VPVLYLKGISTDAFPTALAAILGPQAKGMLHDMYLARADAPREGRRAACRIPGR